VIPSAERVVSGLTKSRDPSRATSVITFDLDGDASVIMPVNAGVPEREPINSNEPDVSGMIFGMTDLREIRHARTCPRILGCKFTAWSEQCMRARIKTVRDVIKSKFPISGEREREREREREKEREKRS